MVKEVVDLFIKGILDAGRTEANEPHRVIFLVQILMR
jgi:hypothetical protein